MAVEGSNEVAEQAVEAPKETPAPVAPAPDPQAQKMAMLARKERAIVNKQREMQQQYAQWQQKLSESEKREKEYAEKEAIRRQNPLRALEDYGHDYQKATNFVLADGQVTPELLKQEIQQIKQEHQAAEQRRQQEMRDMAAQAESQAIEGFKEDLKEFVGAKKNEYKLTNLFDKDAALVYDTIDEYYNTTGKILSHEEATGMVEKYFKKLVDDANGVISPRVPVPPKAPQKVEDGFVTTKSQKTLTNSMNNSTMSPKSPAQTEQEALQRAMRALG